MAESTVESALDGFWTAFLGCDREHLHSTHVFVIPRFVEDDYQGVYILKREVGCLVAVMAREPAELVNRIVPAIGPKRPEVVFDSAFWQATLPEAVRLDGPAFIGYLDEANFTPAPRHSAEFRWLDQKKRAESEAFRRLFAACDINDWERGGLDIDGSNIGAMWMGEQIVAAAAYDQWSGRIAQTGVVVHPDHRGKGLGTSALSQLCEAIFERGLVPQYRAVESDSAAIGLAGKLGFQPWGESLVVTVRESGTDAPDDDIAPRDPSCNRKKS